MLGKIPNMPREATLITGIILGLTSCSKKCLVLSTKHLNPHKIDARSYSNNWYQNPEA